MLINCPKCGFQQPQDKYCAQCGVDMDNFKPASPSPFKKIFGNPLVQFSLLILIAGGSAITLFQQSRQHQSAMPTASTLRVTSSAASNARMPSNTDVDNDDDAESMTLTAASLVESPEESAVTSTDGKATAATNAEEGLLGADTPSPSVTRSQLKIAMIFAEVSQGQLQRIFESSQNTGQFMSFGDYSAGILPTMDEKALRSNRQIKILHRVESSLGTRDPQRWFFGKGDLGLAVQISSTLARPAEGEGPLFRGHIEIQRRWLTLNQNQAPEVEQKSFPAIFEVTPETGFFLSGLLPRRSPLNNDNDFTSIDVFQILRSPNFLGGSTEFVIFIEMEKDR